MSKLADLIARSKAQQKVATQKSTIDLAKDDSSSEPTDKVEQQKLNILKSNQEITAKQDDGNQGQSILDQVQNLLKVLDTKLEDQNLDKTEVGDLVRNIMSRINANPSIAMEVKPEDIGLLVKGARASYALCVAKKSAASKKREEKQKKSQEVADVFDELKLGNL